MTSLTSAIVAISCLSWAQQASVNRITNGSNVRLRTAPDMTAPIVVEMPLGAELSVLDRNDLRPDPWLRVRTGDGREGWVLRRLTTQVDTQHHDETIESVVLDQLKKQAEMNGTTFEARVQLFDLIERTLRRGKDRERNARLAIYRLRSMQLVFNGIPFQGNKREPFRSWLAMHEDAARYNEPAGAWMVDPEYVKNVHNEYRDTSAADDLAWVFAENGLYGECEGDVPCYVSWTNELDGWYLRTHPAGNHKDDANAQVAVKLNGAMDNLRNFPAVLAEFDPTKRCGELHTSLDPLKAAVTASTSRRRPEALAAIDRFAELCKGH